MPPLICSLLDDLTQTAILQLLYHVYMCSHLFQPFYQHVLQKVDTKGTTYGLEVCNSKTVVFIVMILI